MATIFDQITAALARGERVELRGFGAFTMRRRNARIGRNPRTHETVQVDEKTKPSFKAGREMLRRLNGGSQARVSAPGVTATLGSRFTGRSGSGLQPAMVRAHSRASVLSVMPGNSRRSSMAGEIRPLLIDGADRSLLILGDDEHRRSMGRHPAAGNARGAVTRGEATALAPSEIATRRACSKLPSKSRAAAETTNCATAR